MGPAPRPRWAKQGGGRATSSAARCSLAANCRPIQASRMSCSRRGVGGVRGGGLEAALGLLRASLRRRAPARSLMRTPKLHAALLGACGWPFCPSRQHPRVTWRQPFSTPSHSAAKCRDGREVLFPGPPGAARRVGADSPGTVWTLSACDLPSTRSGTTCKPHPMPGSTPGHNAQSPGFNNAFYLHLRLCIVRSCWFIGPRGRLSLHMLRTSAGRKST